MTSVNKTDLHVNNKLNALRLHVARLESANATHRQVEKALARERNPLRPLIDAMPAYIYFKDTEGRFINANLLAARWMGAKTFTDLIARNDFDFHSPKVAMQHYTEDQTVLNSGQPLTGKEVLVAGTEEDEVWRRSGKSQLHCRIEGD